MNRRQFLHSSILGAACFTATSLVLQAAAGKIGKLDPAEFEKLNKEAGAKVEALKATADPLSPADEKLFTEVALGGMMQLELSKLAVEKASSADVKAYAKGEVEEQTVLSAKLKEVAAAKNAKLPAALDEKGAKTVEKLQGLSGAEFDKAYLKEGGVKGHQLLKATMTKVESKATDATLKAMAATALPLIKTHLQVAEDELKDA